MILLLEVFFIRLEMNLSYRSDRPIQCFVIYLVLAHVHSNSLDNKI